MCEVFAWIINQIKFGYMSSSALVWYFGTLGVFKLNSSLNRPIKFGYLSDQWIHQYEHGWIMFTSVVAPSCWKGICGVGCLEVYTNLWNTIQLAEIWYNISDKEIMWTNDTFLRNFPIWILLWAVLGPHCKCFYLIHCTVCAGCLVSYNATDGDKSGQEDDTVLKLAWVSLK